MQQIGIVERSGIVEMWEIAGFSDAEKLWSDLGLNTAYINLVDLMNILCDGFKAISDPEHLSSAQTLRKALSILCQQQLQSVYASLKNVKEERDNLRFNVEEANKRVDALVQELDECKTSYEYKTQCLLKQAENMHSNTIKNLTDQLSTERETNASEIISKKNQIQAFQQEFRRLTDVVMENQQVKVEYEKLRKHNSKLKINYDELLMQMKILAAEHEKVQEIKSIHHEEVIYFENKIQQLQSDIIVLRDQNDELTVELELTKSRNDSKRKLYMFFNSFKRCLVDEDLNIRKVMEYAFTNLKEFDKESFSSSLDVDIIISDLKSLLRDNVDNIKDNVFNFLSEFDPNTHLNSNYAHFSLKFLKLVIRELEQLLTNKFMWIVNELELQQNEMNLASELELSLNSNRNSSMNLVNHVITERNQEQKGEQKNEKEFKKKPAVMVMSMEAGELEIEFEKELQIFEQKQDNDEKLMEPIAEIAKYEELINQQKEASNISILPSIVERYILKMEITRLNEENRILRDKLELQMRNVDRTDIAAQTSDNKLTTRNHMLDNDPSPTNSLHTDYFVHFDNIGETDNSDDSTNFQVSYGTLLSNTDSSLSNFEAENRVVEHSKEAIKDNVNDLHDPTCLNYMIRRLPRYHSPASSSSSLKTNNTGNAVHEDPTHQLLKKKNKDINVKKLTDAMRKQLMNPQDNSDNLNQKDMINILNGIDEPMQGQKKKYRRLFKLFPDQQEDFHNSTRYTCSQPQAKMLKSQLLFKDSQLLKHQTLERENIEKNDN